MKKALMILLAVSIVCWISFASAQQEKPKTAPPATAPAATPKVVPAKEALKTAEGEITAVDTKLCTFTLKDASGVEKQFSTTPVKIKMVKVGEKVSVKYKETKEGTSKAIAIKEIKEKKEKGGVKKEAKKQEKKK